MKRLAASGERRVAGNGTQLVARGGERLAASGVRHAAHSMKVLIIFVYRADQIFNL